MAEILFFVQLFATAYMTGVVWFVQLAHYPLMAAIPREAFVAYERAYTNRMGLIVGPAMLAEMATGAAMIVWRPTFVPEWAVWLLSLLLLVVVASTFGWFVGAHARLSDGFDAELHRRLVLYNAVRTAAWTGRALLLVWLAWQAVTGST
jgi:uncharacterized membrane protein